MFSLAKGRKNIYWAIGLFFYEQWLEIIKRDRNGSPEERGLERIARLTLIGAEISFSK